MKPTDWAVLLGSIAFLLAFYWRFFWSKKEAVKAAAQSPSGIQELEIVLKGGYSPDTVVVRKGTPVRLKFRREESGECTDRVVIPGFRISQPLPAFSTTQVEFTPTEPGEYGFECGMGMIHGRILVQAGSD